MTVCSLPSTRLTTIVSAPSTGMIAATIVPSGDMRALDMKGSLPKASTGGGSADRAVAAENVNAAHKTPTESPARMTTPLGPTVIVKGILVPLRLFGQGLL